MIKGYVSTVALSMSMLQLWGMKQPSTNHVSILPKDLKLVLVSYLTNPYDMVSFLLANKQLALLLKDPQVFDKLITKIVHFKYDEREVIKINTAIGFKTDTAVGWLKDRLVTNKLTKHPAEELFLLAIQGGNVGNSTFFIRSGINTNCVRWGTTPLNYAIMSQAEENNKVQIINLLIQNKADLNTRDSDSHSPLDNALGILYSTGLIKYTESEKELVPKIVERLVKAKANVNATDSYGYTALMPVCFFVTYALSHQERALAKEAIKLILDAGADITIKNTKGQTALSIVEEYDDEGELRELFKQQSFLQDQCKTKEKK